MQNGLFSSHPHNTCHGSPPFGLAQNQRRFERRTAAAASSLTSAMALDTVVFLLAIILDALLLFSMVFYVRFCVF